MQKPDFLLFCYPLSVCQVCVLKRQGLLRCTPASCRRRCTNWPVRCCPLTVWMVASRSFIRNPWRWKFQQTSLTGTVSTCIYCYRLSCCCIIFVYLFWFHCMHYDFMYVFFSRNSLLNAQGLIGGDGDSRCRIVWRGHHRESHSCLAPPPAASKGNTELLIR